MSNKIFKSISGYFKRIKKENERDLDLFELELFYFLKILYVKGDLGGKDIKKRRSLSNERFEELKSFALDKGYILERKEPSHLFSLKPLGKDFLLELTKSRQDKNNAEWIKWVTIVLGISAIVSIVDLFLSKPETKNYILKGIFSAIGLALEIFFVALILWIILKIFILISDKYRRKKLNRKLKKGDELDADVKKGEIRIRRKI